tara:strand:- start:1950 stop:2201 length:252 start_codon:yes stop_codon:yes gene_type:complete
MLAFPFFWDCRQRGIGIVEPFIFLFKMDMIGDTGKAIEFWNFAQVILAMVLADGLDVPMDQDLVKMSGDGRCLHQFVVRCAHP